MHKTPPIRLLPESGCGSCSPSGCQGGFGHPCPRPELQGQPELVQGVFESLRQVVDAEGGNLVDRRLVKSLRIDGGEVELTVSFAPGCGIARDLAEGAFQTLRRLLPDTDVYVRHAA